MKKHVMTVYGTRPEAIKVAPVIKALEADDRFESIAVVTGQHRHMLDQVNSVFGIEPKHDLDVFQEGQSLNSLVSRVFKRLAPVLQQEKPDAVLVQGDTSTVAAAAIAAFYEKIPVVHLEAGLRSGDIMSPYPEEANRKITSQVTALHLAPTSESKKNLLRENFEARDIVITGNTVIDALLHAVRTKIRVEDDALREAIEQERPILLATAHRRENWGDAMVGVGRALRQLAERYPHYLIVLPAHKNPVVREAILPQLEGLENVLATEPIPYGEFTQVMQACNIVLTDSGGVQEEAPSLGKPVLVIRDNTERPEAVVAGTVKLIGTDEERLVAEVSKLIDDPVAHAAMANKVNPYGDGNASQRTVAAIAELLGVGKRLPDFSVK